MNCIICRQADLIDRFTSITFEREEFKFVINKIPAQVCPACGEAIVTEEVAMRLLAKAEDEVNQGLLEAILEY